VLAARFGLNPTPGLTDYLTGNANPEEVLQVVVVPPSSARTNGQLSEVLTAQVEEPRFFCITAGTSTPRPAELLASQSFANLLAEVADVYDSVILDCTPILSVADTLDLIPHATAVLVCVRVDQTTRDQARAARAALELLPSKPTGVVLTGLSERSQGYHGYYPPYATQARHLSLSFQNRRTHHLRFFVRAG
jgi:Mrp family chromosome partitioning ATPase